MPSATAKRSGSSRATSWLEVRTRPTSDADPDRRTVIAPPAPRSPRHLKDGPPYLHEVAAADLRRFGDALGVHEGAVRRAEVLHVDATVLAEQPRVHR